MLRGDLKQLRNRRPMPAKNAFYAQSGGVTAVINATACGVIETARKHKSRIRNVYAGRNGIIGALTEDMIDTNRESASTIAALRHTPGGAFGSARYKLKSIEENRAEYERLIEVFKAHNIGYFFYKRRQRFDGHGPQGVADLARSMGFPVYLPRRSENRRQ